MKIRPKSINTLIRASVALMFVLATSSFIQGSSDIQEFQLVIKYTDNGLELEGLKGTAWKKLKFTTSSDHPQAIDENGMTEVDKSTSKDAGLADFLFTVAKTKDGIMLNGVKGTAWKKLTFTLSKDQSQKIDQMGMTE